MCPIATSFSKPRLQPRGGDFCGRLFFFFFPFFLSFFFFNDLEEGREGTRPRVMISSPDSDVSAGNLQVAAPPPNSSPEGRYLDASEKQLRQIVGEWPQLRAGEF